MGRIKRNKKDKSIAIIGQVENNVNANYADERITHSKFKNHSFNNVNFHRAAVTGSVFENCIFTNCNFNDADFEFCEFVNCTINMKEVKNCSFNNSNFISSCLTNIHFSGCTFTNTYFVEVSLDSVNIIFSTLEGACFNNCNFSNLDWQELNLEYTEFIKPCMKNVTLPFLQVPYIFGILEYIASTKDDISLCYNSRKMSLTEFKDYGINTLIKECENHLTLFPQINIFLFYKYDDEKAYYALRTELMNLKASRDYRGIKHCCKLIALSQKFNNKQLNDFYNSIVSLDASIEPLSPEMKSFSRHIGEIRAILYSRKSNRSIKAKFKTNIGIEESTGFSTLCSLMHKFAKSQNPKNTYVKFVLEYNSPLIICVEIDGNIEELNTVIQALIILATGLSPDVNSYPFVKSALACSMQNEEQSTSFLNEAFTAHNKLVSLGIYIYLIDYYVENCEDYVINGDCTYYLNGEIESYGGGQLLNHAS